MVRRPRNVLEYQASLPYLRTAKKTPTLYKIKQRYALPSNGEFYTLPKPLTPVKVVEPDLVL